MGSRIIQESKLLAFFHQERSEYHEKFCQVFRRIVFIEEEMKKDQPALVQAICSGDSYKALHIRDSLPSEELTRVLISLEECARLYEEMRRLTILLGKSIDSILLCHSRMALSLKETQRMRDGIGYVLFGVVFVSLYFLFHFDLEFQ